MPTKRYKPENVVAMPRQVDVLVSQGEHDRRHPPDGVSEAKDVPFQSEGARK